MEIKLNSKAFSAGVFDSSYKFPGIKVTENRKVTQYELEIFTESGGTSFIGDESHKIRPGRVLCARPGDFRHSELPVKCFYVKISPEMKDIAEILEKLPRFFKIRNEEKCVSLIKSMIISSEASEALSAMSKLLELMAVLNTESQQFALLDNIPQKKNRAAVELAIEYMEEHFRERCTLEEVAEAAHFSSVYFHGLFRKAVGKTPYEYLSELRIDEAKSLLLTEEQDMSKISELCGFSSQSYFNYVFKKETGDTPSAYRRKNIAKYCT